jgi:hypothetical protein
MREERRRMLSLTSLGLTPEQAFTLLTDDDIITAMTEPDPMEGLVDASDKIEGGGVITWWNNIEKDKRYVQFVFFSTSGYRLIVSIILKIRYLVEFCGSCELATLALRVQSTPPDDYSSISWLVPADKAHSNWFAETSGMSFS